MPRTLLFAYGSLVDDVSRAATVPEHVVVVGPATLAPSLGYSVAADAGKAEGGPVFLGMRRAVPSRPVPGLLLEVRERSAWRKLDAREGFYSRTAIASDGAGGVVYAYVTKPAFQLPRPAPRRVERRYVSLVRRGFRAHGLVPSPL